MSEINNLEWLLREDVETVMVMRVMVTGSKRRDGYPSTFSVFLSLVLINPKLALSVG